MKINSIEFDLNLSEPEVFKSILVEVEVYNRMVDLINKMDISDKENFYRKKVLFCIILENIFGKGAHKKIFNGEVTINKCENVKKQINRELNKQYYSKLKGKVIKFPLLERRGDNVDG